MLYRIAAAGLLGASLAQAVEIKYESDAPYCGREVLKVSVKKLFPSAATATVGPVLPLEWGPNQLPHAPALEWALERSFKAAKAGSFKWLGRTLQALELGSQHHKVVLCIVDACARIENHGEVLYLPLPRLQVKRPRIMGVRATVEGRPGQFLDQQKGKKPAAKKKGRERVPSVPKDGRMTDPEAPSALLASTPQSGSLSAVAWTADFWAEGARYLVASQMAGPGFEADPDLVLLLDAIAPYAIQSEVHQVFMQGIEGRVSDSCYDGAREAIRTAFDGREQALKRALERYEFDAGNIYSRALELLD